MGRHSFEPTYEELKLFLFASVFHEFFRFEPTYEELKLICQKSRCASRYSFEPTYEELKLKIIQRETYFCRLF